MTKMTSYPFGFKKTQLIFRIAVLIAIGSLALPVNGLKADSDWLSLATDEDQEKYTIRFNDVAASELINFVSRISGKNFIYDPKQIDFKVTIVSDEPVGAQEVLASLMQIMKANGFSATIEGDTILFYTADAKSQKSNHSLPRLATADTAEGVVTRIFNIKYASVDDVLNVVTTLATSDSNVAFIESSRHIIISDSAVNLERIAQLIESIDIMDATRDVEVYKVKYANMSALKSFAEQILTPLANDSFSLIPNLNSNSLFIIGSRQIIDKAVSILNTLDVPSELEIIAKARENRTLVVERTTDPAKLLDPQINPEFYVYKLQYHQGDSIMQSLRQISTAMISSDTEMAIDAQLLNSMNSLQWLEPTNSLIFTGNDATLIKMKNLVQSLDTPVKQVFIEALIIDTSIKNSHAFSVDFGTNFSWDPARVGATLGNFSSTNLRSNVNTNHTAKSFEPPVSASSGFSTGVIGSAIGHNGNVFATIGALVTAVESDVDSKIVLNPKIITEDNVTCEFFVGEKSRLKTGAVQNSGNNNVTSSNFEVIGIGTTLKITPTISSDELITLQVEQETSTSLDTSQATDSSALVPISKTSTTKTRLHVPDQHFVILSGMIDSKKDDRFSKVPVLGSVPLLGWLFRSNSNSDDRRTLLFFIRPHVVRTLEEARQITQRHIDIVDQRKYLEKDMDENLQFTRKANTKITPPAEPVITAPLSKARS
jgi:type III secretion protein C